MTKNQYLKGVALILPVFTTLLLVSDVYSYALADEHLFNDDQREWLLVSLVALWLIYNVVWNGRSIEEPKKLGHRWTPEEARRFGAKGRISAKMRRKV
jgi:hypothetical protein